MLFPFNAVFAYVLTFNIVIAALESDSGVGIGRAQKLCKESVDSEAPRMGSPDGSNYGSNVEQQRISFSSASSEYDNGLVVGPAARTPKRKANIIVEALKRSCLENPPDTTKEDSRALYSRYRAPFSPTSTSRSDDSLEQRYIRSSLQDDGTTADSSDKSTFIITSKPIELKGYQTRKDNVDPSKNFGVQIDLKLYAWIGSMKNNRKNYISLIGSNTRTNYGNWAKEAFRSDYHSVLRTSQGRAKQDSSFALLKKILNLNMRFLHIFGVHPEHKFFAPEFEALWRWLDECVFASRAILHDRTKGNASPISTSPMQERLNRLILAFLGSPSDKVIFLAKPMKANPTPSACTQKTGLATQAALHILGSYYKTTNSTKWKGSFLEDIDFLKLFSEIKFALSRKNPSNLQIISGPQVYTELWSSTKNNDQFVKIKGLINKKIPKKSSVYLRIAKDTNEQVDFLSADDLKLQAAFSFLTA